ncbi:zinc finger BED domain-containing protein RICESLEEPER 2-like protein [Tanacetum coccineum]|uniref:Zinc finger BED domain-containing protein RICESLEEPER 2-like protein n=1 Tax=Tanacetum coccineum TaxID=301880 RepID=A0ABQ5HP10_9ASTR
MGVCKARRQPDIRQRILAGNSQSDLINYVYNEKDGRNALAKMVILHEYPLSIVDHTGFKSFTRTIQPLFKCPSRNTLKSDIIKLYGEQKNQVIKDIENNQSRVAITSDMFLYVPCSHTSEVLTNVLMDALIEWNVDTKLSTITVDNCTTNDSLIGLDCQTRWNATYLMLKTALMYKDVFARLKQRDSQYKTLPSPLEWENARVICDTLKVFYEGDIHELMGVAAVLDPRNKMEMIKFYFELIYPRDSEARVLQIEDLCKELVNEYQSKTSQSAYGVQDNIGSSSTSLIEVDENLSAWEKHILSQNSVPQSAVKMEFEHYLDEGLEPRSQDFDILLWWMLRADKYLVLQAIARDILAIPASTVASESAFSASGRLISPHQSRLHPNTIKALMCKPFTSDNHESIFDDYDTDVEEILVRVDEW